MGGWLAQSREADCVFLEHDEVVSLGEEYIDLGRIVESTQGVGLEESISQIHERVISGASPL